MNIHRGPGPSRPQGGKYGDNHNDGGLDSDFRRIPGGIPTTSGSENVEQNQRERK